MSTSFVKSTIQLNNGISMPRIHLGVYQASGRKARDAATWALRAGYRAIDSAEAYGNEKEVGVAILDFLKTENSLSREDIWFTTKLMNNTSYDATRVSIKDSIMRSRLGYIDLYLLHSPYLGKAKRLECWKAVEDAIIDGEVRAGGVSNWSVVHLQELLVSKPRITPLINQIEVHPFNTRTDITTFCQENGIVVQAYAPLARALRMEHPTIVRLSTKYQISPAQLLVRWSLQKGYVPLPKSVHEGRIVDNVQVDNFTIQDEDMEVMDALDEYLVTDWDPTTSA